MATNKLGKGTVNVTVNLLEEEHAVLTKIAVADERSLGDVVRRLAMAGLRVTNPDAAYQMERARRAHREQMILKLK